MANNKIVFDILANSSQYAASMANVGKVSDDTSKAIKTAFAASTIAIGSTLTAFGKYETQLIKVGKTADISGKDLDDFGKSVIALSAKIPLSTNELLELAASAAQLGVKGKDNILKFTETVAKLGTATNIVGEEGAQQIARLLNITGEGVGTVDRFAAIITRLGNNVAATEAEILSMASRVGKATAQFELGTPAILGISAALKEIGIEAELGGSAIGRTFFQIQDAVFKGGEALETFSAITGKSGEELKQIFEQDATQAFQLFIDSLNKLPADQVATAMSSMGLEGVRLIEVVGTLAKRSDLLATNLAMASDEAVKQTALNQEFERAVVSLENSFKIMKNELVNLATSMGKELAPAAKEIIDEMAGIFRAIRSVNEASGGLITSSLVMAAKISALVIATNKLKNVLISTGLISAAMASQMGIATTATAAQGAMSAASAIKNGALALSFGAVKTAAMSAVMAVKSFQIGLGSLVGGLLIAYEAGKKLGDLIGKLGGLKTSEQDLASSQKELNGLLQKRVALEEKAGSGDEAAKTRLDALNQEIQKREGLITILEKEVAARAGAASGGGGGEQEITSQSFASATDPAILPDDLSEKKAKEEEKLQIFEEGVENRLAAAQREAELMKQIEAGATVETIAAMEERNRQLSEIEAKKAELDRVNRDLSRTNIAAHEQSILESKRSAIEQELVIMQEKFDAIQVKTEEQEAADMEKRVAAKQILNQKLTEQETAFLEAKKEKDIEEREADIELKTIQAEEDLAFLQSKLMTEEQLKDQVRQERLSKEAARRNQELKNEIQYGAAVGKAHSFFQSEEVKGVQSTMGLIGQIKTKEGSKAGAAQKAFAMADAAIKIPQAMLSAYTSMVGIPVVGPALAVTAAAAAGIVGMQNLNAIRSAETPSYAVGTDFVPADTMAQIHAGEAIIPAKENQFLQSGDLMLGSPNSFGDQENSQPASVVNVNFEGANFFGDFKNNDEIINQIFEGIAIGINEGRLPGFEQTTLAVTG